MNGIPDSNCVFVGDKNQPVISSIMAAPYIANVHIIFFYSHISNFFFLAGIENYSFKFEQAYTQTNLYKLTLFLSNS